jgi:uncharacterized protein YggU (UPF0235/DUF167 family)
LSEGTTLDSRTVKVKVYTRSSRPRIETDTDGTYRVFVSSAPEKGKANAEVIKALARHLGVRKSALEVVSGLTAREKVIRIEE